MLLFNISIKIIYSYIISCYHIERFLDMNILKNNMNVLKKRKIICFLDVKKLTLYRNLVILIIFCTIFISKMLILYIYNIYIYIYIIYVTYNI